MNVNHGKTSRHLIKRITLYENAQSARYHFKDEMHLEYCYSRRHLYKYELELEKGNSMYRLLVQNKNLDNFLNSKAGMELRFYAELEYQKELSNVIKVMGLIEVNNSSQLWRVMVFHKISDTV